MAIISQGAVNGPVNCILPHLHVDRKQCIENPCAKCGTAFSPRLQTRGSLYYLHGQWLCGDCNMSTWFPQNTPLSPSRSVPSRSVELAGNYIHKLRGFFGMNR